MSGGDPQRHGDIEERNLLSPEPEQRFYVHYPRMAKALIFSRLEQTARPPDRTECTERDSPSLMRDA